METQTSLETPFQNQTQLLEQAQPQTQAQPQSRPRRLGQLREKLRARALSRKQAPQIEPNTAANATKLQIAGLNVAIWKPASVNGKAPLVIFSHGFTGSATQTTFLMKALAGAGYIVLAPDHADAHGARSTHHRPLVSFKKPQEWTDKTYIDRHDDIVNLIAALHANPTWNSQIDWSRLGLCGHSLGGYTVLGLAGAWPSWKIPGVKAVVALSPYVTPYMDHGALGKVDTPVMYQGGTRDFGITPFVKKDSAGAFAKTSSPACFVEFDKFNHFTWTGFNWDPEKQHEINYYCIAFFNKYVKGIDDGELEKRIPGVVDYRTK